MQEESLVGIGSEVETSGMQDCNRKTCLTFCKYFFLSSMHISVYTYNIPVVSRFMASQGLMSPSAEGRGKMGAAMARNVSGVQVYRASECRAQV